MLSVYESEASIVLSRSDDNGKSWTQGEKIAKPEGIVRASVPEIIELRNGEILVAYNTRPPQNNDNEQLRFGLKVIKSLNQGNSWSDPINVYEGGHTWHRGVWEPVMMQLDDELLLFFANEHPYSESEDQEISFVKSDDDGLTWSQPKTVSYRKGHRDGMPVPVKLQNSGEIRIAIEDNGIFGGEFKPVILGFSSQEALSDSMISGRSNNRWRALTEDDQLAEHEYGGAPYLVQIPSGETILSFQSTKDRDVAWNFSTMAVAIGDHDGKNFSRVTEPFRVGRTQSAMWNSLHVKNDNTVTAVTSTNAFSNDGKSEIYSIDGRILSDIIIPNGNITKETASTLSEKGLQTIARMGAYSPVSASVYALKDSEYLHLGFKVNNRAANNSTEFESTDLMIANGLLYEDEISEGMFKVSYDREGRVTSYEGKNGKWSPMEEDLKTNVFRDSDHEKEVMISIPLSGIGLESDPPNAIGLNANLNVRNVSSTEIINETLGGNKEFRPSTWSKAIILNNNE